MILPWRILKKPPEKEKLLKKRYLKKNEMLKLVMRNNLKKNITPYFRGCHYHALGMQLPALPDFIYKGLEGALSACEDVSSPEIFMRKLRTKSNNARQEFLRTEARRLIGVAKNETKPKFAREVAKLLIVEYKMQLNVIEAKAPWDDTKDLEAFFFEWLPVVRAEAIKKNGTHAFQDAMDKVLEPIAVRQRERT